MSTPTRTEEEDKEARRLLNALADIIFDAYLEELRRAREEGRPFDPHVRRRHGEKNESVKGDEKTVAKIRSDVMSEPN